MNGHIKTSVLIDKYYHNVVPLSSLASILFEAGLKEYHSGVTGKIMFVKTGKNEMCTLK
jgi:hypothetical protein